nr:4a-hydroxytetrahydrobiopterin dehydratase [Actinomycetales bacterium]
DHHPDLTLRYGWVDVSLWSHDALGVTSRDINLAREISRIAATQRISARPEALAGLEVAIDASDPDSIGPFWGAVLTGGQSSYSSEGEDVEDASGQVPLLWFQRTEPHEEPRQRFHLDVWVPHDVAEERVAAALAAGGRLVSAANAPSFWVLADTDGNRACICTPLGREN